MLRRLCAIALLMLCFRLEAEVYDCFLFLNELEVLDIRLHEMDPAVDKFVLVESFETFRGNPKPLIFLENLHLFANFLDKIIHVVVESFETANPWHREHFQRNAIMRGLTNCDEDDIILISDVDEIVQEKGVLKISSLLRDGTFECFGVNQKYHSTFLNSIPSPEMWYGTVATTYSHLKDISPQGARNIKDIVPKAANGWHFTWLGDVERVLYKLGAFSHEEADTPEGREHTRREAERRYECQIMEVDETFPRYIQDNQAYFESIEFVLTFEKQRIALGLS